MLGAALIHPDKREVIPLMPEPIIKPDGADKNDCERNAAKRLIAKLRQDHPHLKVIVTEDSLSSNAPHIEVLHDHHLHYSWGSKKATMPTYLQQVAAAEQAGRVTYYDRDDAKTGAHHRFRFVSDVPLNASHADLRVNFLECWEWDRGRSNISAGSPTCGSTKARCISSCGEAERGGASKTRRSIR